MPAPTTAVHFSLSYIMPGASVPMQSFALALNYEFAALLAEERTGCRPIPLSTPCSTLCYCPVQAFPYISKPDPGARQSLASLSVCRKRNRPPEPNRTEASGEESREGTAGWPENRGESWRGTWAAPAAFTLHHPKSWSPPVKTPLTFQPYNSSFRIHRNSERLRGIRAHQIRKAKIIIIIINT